MNIKRFVALACVVVLGIAAGVGVSAMVGGGASDNPCEGFGALADEIDVRAEDSSTGKAERYHVCEQLGYRVIIDADTRAVVHTAFREEELLEYYQQHPEENPLEIANKTAEAELADSFVEVQLPEPVPGADCPGASARRDFAEVTLSVCVPDGWIAEVDATKTLNISWKSGIIGVFPSSVRDSYGTRCPMPQRVATPAGDIRVCALPVNSGGGQGHGVILPSGRLGGLSLYEGATEEERILAFHVLFSITEMGTESR